MLMVTTYNLSDLREFANSCRLATDILDKFRTNKPLEKVV